MNPDEIEVGGELKPCPFCGGKGQMLTAKGGFAPGCNSVSECLMFSGTYHVYENKADAIAAWNTRVTPALRAMLEKGEEVNG